MWFLFRVHDDKVNVDRSNDFPMKFFLSFLLELELLEDFNPSLIFCDLNFTEWVQLKNNTRMFLFKY